VRTILGGAHPRKQLESLHETARRIASDIDAALAAIPQNDQNLNQII
jgi:hypothetical protein